MSSPVVHTLLPRSWRDLAQPVAPRAMSREGRRRRAFAAAQVGGLVLVVAAVAWGGVEIASVWQHDPGALVVPAGAAPVRTITLKTDGVLDAAWLRATLALPPKAGLMALDLPALQRRLRAGGQVESAELTRVFPDRLAVTLKERAPVARVMAQAGGAPPVQLLVARDGTVFAGVGHAPDFVAALPFLDGVKLTREGAGFAPIAGMPAVAGLLDVARANTPELARGFRIVSLARFEADDLILVRSDAVHEITFGGHADFLRQLAQLDYVLGQLSRETPAQPLGSVNLAVGGGQVPVSRSWSVAALRPVAPSDGAAGPSAGAAGSALFPLPPQFFSTSHDL
jgi:hypothetical protein